MSTATETRPPSRNDRRRAALIATVVALPLTLVLVLVVVALESRGSDPAPAPAPTVAGTAGALPPIAVDPPPALTAAAQKSCQELIAALPTLLGDLPARPVDSPSPYVVAWGDPAVTLRCGVARPPAFIATADVQQINTVSWFSEGRGDRTAWTVVDRPVYVEVVVPTDAASAPVARLSTAVSRALKAQALDPAD
jgi:hypothetical protein